MRLNICIAEVRFYALYSFPVCTASVFTTSPALTCFLAGFSFLGGFGPCWIGIGSGCWTSLIVFTKVRCDLSQ